MNRHQFEQTAKKFRAGRIALDQFADLLFAKDKDDSADNDSAGSNLHDSLPLPARATDSHKGDFGRVLVIGGSQGMSGAVALTGMAALRSGSGMVQVATPLSQQAVVAAASPCLMTLGLVESKGRFSKDAVNELVEHCEWADVIAIGPGMGRSKSLQKITRLLYSQLPQPVVFDADALNNLADGGAELADHEGLRVLTPHVGEFQRLSVLKGSIGRKDLEKHAAELALRADVTIVLKGRGTFVTDGAESFRNETGNPGMATAGAGDVLTGIIAALIGQGLPPFEAAKHGAAVHGLAGDLGAAELGQTSLLATDLIDFLPDAFQM